MGVDSRRPPLPAPTESMGETSGAETEVATNVTARTDKTSYEVPEDGSPITISTQKITVGRDGGRPGHHRQKSQTSLLIEYFEAGKTGDKVRSRPSVRVKVTPSARKKSGGHDAIQVTSVGKDRKSSYTRRISLGSSRNAEVGLMPLEGTEISHSSESNLSSRPPVEIEVMQLNPSDMSNGRSLMYAHNESNASSMPPDSMLEGSGITGSEMSRETGRSDEVTITDHDHLKAPIRSRSRSTSRDRITQKVMEKLGQPSGKTRKSSTHSRERSKEFDAEGYPLKERRRRSSKTHRLDDDTTISGAESSLLSSQLNPSQRSYRSGTSTSSRMTNNPKLLEMVEDTIKRMILPEINALKEDQKTDRNLRSFDNGRHGSLPKDGYESPELERRVSKSSSTPNIASKPKVVLNREGDDPGTVLSRGDSERKKARHSSREYTERPSSRKSSGRHSRQSDGHEDEERVRRKSSKSSHGLRDGAAAGLAGGILTAAALQHHDSQADLHERRRKHSRSHGSSRSRSASLAETTTEETYGRKEAIPPMPMASHINDSDITRDSIVSVSTERPVSRGQVMTPVREVARGSIGNGMSPVSASRTPTRTTPGEGGRGLGMGHGNQSIGSSNGGISSKARMAAFTAAGLGGAAAVEGHHQQGVDADGYGEEISHRGAGSPAQSVSSLKKQFEEEESLIPSGLRPKSAASRSSAGRSHEKKASQASLLSVRSSPTTQRLAQSRKHSQNVSGDEFITPLERPDAAYLHESAPGTPTNGESVDEWYERQHQLNDRYRDSYGETTNRDSYQTNPYPEDDKRFTTFTDDSFGMPATEAGDDELQNVRGLGANPIYHDHVGVQSNVASLMEPSVLSSNLLSSQSSLPAKHNGTYSDRMAAHLRDMDRDGHAAATYEGSTLSQSMPSQDRWAAIKGHARDMSAGSSRDNVDFLDSARQSPAKLLKGERSADEAPVLGASGLPVAHDPLPEIGHFDDAGSEVSGRRSIVEGPLGGDATGRDPWPYPEEHAHFAQKQLGSPDSRSLRSGPSHKDGLLAAAAGGAAVLAAAHAAKQPRVEDEYDEQRGLMPDMRHDGEEIDREATPTGSPAAFRDEGYATDAQARSAGALTPQYLQEKRYSQEEVNEYNRAMDAQSLGDDDPFTGNATHARQISGHSHGMASPLYDSAKGTGLDKIKSQDIVVLMDHLTVRDAQRNARDTEILVTLVRSAAEMRQSFDEMRQFIKEQDRLIMQNTDRDAEHTVQTVSKALGGPRPLHPSSASASPRTVRGSSQEDVQAKRKGVLRRALKGLTGGRKADDLARVEDMLMQILDNVEDLKHGGASTRPQAAGSFSTDTLDSYEKLRAAPDSGYEPEGLADTSSTPSHSGHLSNASKLEKQQFHSGYDGRRGSVNRVSTVMEGDEDDELTPDEDHLLHHQFENNERMLTPTQESVRNNRGFSPNDTPYHGAETLNGAPIPELTPKTADKQRKHKSNSSSIFAVPKVSRWSKTTTSSGAPDVATLDSPNNARGPRPISAASRSSTQTDRYNDERYDDDLRSPQSMTQDQDRPVSQAETRSVHSQVSKLTRTPSPLIPSETSFKHHDDYSNPRSPVQEDLDHAEFDDPKYQAHRNSLLLQHPQPRQGPTGRHQNTLETKAEDYDVPSGTSSDVSQRTVSDFDPTMWGSSGTAALARNRFSQAEPLSPASMGSAGRSARDEGPLVPQAKTVATQAKPAVPPRVYEPEYEPEHEPQYSASGFSKGGYYTSPYGSGHLLEPIEEVRYSLETDSGHLSPEPQVARAVDMRSSARKITGPRPMGARSPQPAKLVENGGTIRRKPVAHSEVSDDSLESDTF
ncbi:hypothetical protein LTR53_002059 [Teratosphaeriaceae sp. CCFEE 6253]|nr:hypothetical protein LTR53_002059 [Teratosphaeriaceae sp. CCFEE 6253]